MNILFIHQNFPGQFKHLAPALVARGHKVVAMPLSKIQPGTWNGVRISPYQLDRENTPGIHPLVAETETKVIRGEACFKACLRLKREGFEPDVIIAHPGWGETLYINQVWPNTKVGVYCEFFYSTNGNDYGFDTEYQMTNPLDACRVMMKNVINLMYFETSDSGISPTKWQASTFPERFRSKITVIHDGIDTDVVAPNPKATLGLSNGLQLSRQDEIITFVNRNLEPYRGYHIFMRALPEILKRRPEAKVLIVGGNDISYGARAPDGRSWRDIFIAEVRPQISDADWARVFFLGNVPYEHFIPLLQISTVHVYLTYPFVLSWSLLEAMSVGCSIVASNTQPVREAIRDHDTGLLVDFFDVQGLTNEVCRLLDDHMLRRKLGANARAFVKKTYDLKNVCLPRQIEWVEKLGGAAGPSSVAANPPTNRKRKK